MLQKLPVRRSCFLAGAACTARALVRLSLEKAPVTGKVQPAQGCPGDRLADRSGLSPQKLP